MPSERCVVIGGGPAGLTAALELSKLGIPAAVFERDNAVGGIARTANYKGYRFDLGGHRFFTKVDVVQNLWTELLGDDLLVRPRISRIFYEDTFFHYPLKPMNALLGLGPLEAVRILGSYVAAQLSPSPDESTFEDWVCNRFGRRLYEIFFKTYTEKVWGMPCDQIGADWAAQRIKNLDLVVALKNALLGPGRGKGGVTTTLIDEFLYPRLGPGMMWERCRDLLSEKGVPVQTGAQVVRIHHQEGHVSGVTLRDHWGHESEESATHVLSSMPIRELLHVLDPPPPAELLAAANRLSYRDFLTVMLICKRADLFPDNWIYVHSPKVQVARIQNFKNWSPELVPDPATSSLGLEYFVCEGDELWNTPDDELVALARRECALLGLADEGEIVDGTVVRVPKAYPVYDPGYGDALTTIRSYLDGLSGLQLIGRNGQHRYNNMDHSMVTAIYAARNVAGATYDVWDVNVDEEYHEEVRERHTPAGERLVPERASRDVDGELVRRAFARYDPMALGGTLGIVAATVLFLMTATLLLKGGDPIGPNLSLFGNYLIGYQVTWSGALLGALEAGVAGLGFGLGLASAINAVVGWHEARFLREIELARTLDPFREESA